MQNEGRRFRPSLTSSSQSTRAPSIHLPPSLFREIDTLENDGIGVVFTFYEKSTLFPAGDHTKNDTNLSQLATKIIAAHVVHEGRVESFIELQEPVTVLLKMEEVSRFYNYSHAQL